MTQLLYFHCKYLSIFKTTFNLRPQLLTEQRLYSEVVLALSWS